MKTTFSPHLFAILHPITILIEVEPDEGVYFLTFVREIGTAFWPEWCNFRSNLLKWGSFCHGGDVLEIFMFFLQLSWRCHRTEMVPIAVTPSIYNIKKVLAADVAVTTIKGNADTAIQIVLIAVWIFFFFYICKKC